MNSTSNDFELYYCSLEKHFLYSKVYLDLVGFLYEKKKSHILQVLLKGVTWTKLGSCILELVLKPARYCRCLKCFTKNCFFFSVLVGPLWVFCSFAHPFITDIIGQDNPGSCSCVLCTSSALSHVPIPPMHVTNISNKGRKAHVCV